MLYVLVAGTFETVDTPHKGEVLGQTFDLTQAEVQSAVVEGRACLMPKDEYDDLFAGVDPKLIEKHSNARTQANAPADFQAKLGAARDAAVRHRQELIAAADQSKKANS